MYIIIAIRDYPDLPIGWRGSYLVGQSDNINEAREMAREEVQQRGGKYGCVVYYTGRVTATQTNVALSIPRFEYNITA